MNVRRVGSPGPPPKNIKSSVISDIFEFNDFPYNVNDGVFTFDWVNQDGTGYLQSYLDNNNFAAANTVIRFQTSPITVEKTSSYGTSDDSYTVDMILTYADNVGGTSTKTVIPDTEIGYQQGATVTLPAQSGYVMPTGYAKYDPIKKVRLQMVASGPFLTVEVAGTLSFSATLDY